MISYGKQSISDDDIEAVVDVLKSDYLTQGCKVTEFEKAVSAYTGAKYSVAVNSGTSALHIACLALGLGNNDYLWTSPLSFVASANCGIYCGAEVDFVDIDPDTSNIGIGSLRRKLEIAKKKGLLPKVLVAVHMSGLSCQMEDIYDLSKQYGFKVIEDACHAIGGRYKEEVIGSCKYSDITVFSFHPVKTITTGEGGMAVTNDATAARSMRLFANHGITRDPALMTGRYDGSWYYQQISLGYNYRLTDIQAALGTSQLKRLDKFVVRRHQLADLYDELLRDLPVVLPKRPLSYYSGMHLYVIRLKISKIKISRRQVVDEMRKKGIGVNVHYIPIYLQPFYQNRGFMCGQYPQAESYYSEALTLPLFPDLKESDVAMICRVLRECIL